MCIVKQKYTHWYIYVFMCLYKYIHKNICLCACISFSWIYIHMFTIEFRGMQTGENRKARKVYIYLSCTNRNGKTEAYLLIKLWTYIHKPWGCYSFDLCLLTIDAPFMGSVVVELRCVCVKKHFSTLRTAVENWEFITENGKFLPETFWPRNSRGKNMKKSSTSTEDQIIKVWGRNTESRVTRDL